MNNCDKSPVECLRKLYPELTESELQWEEPETVFELCARCKGKIEKLIPLKND
uniref:Uncharacterized protein n=1 Tax=uncultured marine virus TaxID=186617 RepID=A0A0F7L3X8_9VIRU|nr:hypothetical protein [uncultured marine virus]